MGLLSQYTNDKRVESLMEKSEKEILKMYRQKTECGNDTPLHVKRTMELMGIMVDAFNEHVPHCFSELDKFALMRAAELHDIGKLGIPVEILNKDGRPTNEEFDIIKKHPQIGYDIIAHIEKTLEKTLPELSAETTKTLKYAKQMALNHHEKMDGSGYPNGISGEEIPIVARMMAIVDVLEALTAKRAYKEPMPFEKAEAILRQDSGSIFDPELIKYFFDNEKIKEQIKEVLGEKPKEIPFIPNER